MTGGPRARSSRPGGSRYESGQLQPQPLHSPEGLHGGCASAPAPAHCVMDSRAQGSAPRSAGHLCWDGGGAGAW